MDTKPTDATKLKLLVVDDDPAIAELVKELLADAFTITCFHKPLDALAAAEKAPPDLALLDVMMPEMNGLKMAQRLRALPDGKAIRIYIMTAHHGLQPEIARANVDGFIAKPFDPDELIRRLSAAAGGD